MTRLPMTRRNFGALAALPAFDDHGILVTPAQAAKLRPGVDVQKSIRYLTPYILHPETWKQPQFAKFNPEGTFFQGFAGVGLGDEALLAAYRSLARNGSPWVRFIDLAVRA